jgi:glycine dehydrogenase
MLSRAISGAVARRVGLRRLIPVAAFSTKVSLEEFETNPKIPNSLKASDSMVYRHIGPNVEESNAMLKSMGLNSLKELIEQTIPSSILLNQGYLENPSAKIPLPSGYTESLVLERLKNIAKKNKIYKSYIGCGYYPSIMPQVILRNVLENPAWYTSYTPYQAEISQGRLEALIHYQTMITEMTKMDIANASLLDEATAGSEAMFMCYSIHDGTKKTFLISKDVFPQTLDVVKTRAHAIGVKLEVIDPDTYDYAGNKDICGVLLQTPDNLGRVRDYSEVIKKVHAAGAHVAVSADLMSLALMKPQGEMDADIAFGSTQRFGLPMSYGGPHAGYFATKDDLKRKMPGRIIGISVDSHGNPGYRMALGTREQHIKREKATSNICTAQALLANLSGFYSIYHGPKGIEQIATRIHNMAQVLHHSLKAFNCKLITKEDEIFDTVAIDLKGSRKSADELLKLFEKHEMNLRKIDNSTVSVSISEATTMADLHDLLSVFAEAYSFNGSIKDVMGLENINYLKPVSNSLKRTSKYLKQDIFNNIHSESQMLRFLYKLQQKDLSLATAMIPLGSCTMKATTTSEMTPITWPEFTGVHPFVPKDQAAGYLEMIDKLKDYLKNVTGYDEISLQPNSGAQGELTGLLTVKKYYECIGQGHRNICFIPSSAHGTNPASCVVAGLELVAIKCDSHGNVSLEDIKEKAKEYKDKLCCLMITYPSTHGVFEDNIMEIIQVIHDHGGQVYMDGANMNAQCGLTSPGYMGADVGHLNLHKTFGIPHGGGGPGVGPIGVKKHLIPHLPSHPVTNPDKENKSLGSTAAAEFGSAGILPITFVYLESLGKEGIRTATSNALLNSNYLMDKLKDHYKVVYTGSKGRCGHEFIIDMRPFKKHGVTEEDVAKRLMDYNFHAPTMSFPVAGTLMVEPTESEDKGELDRFCDAMIAIRKEIQDVADGKLDKKDNPLKNAPHCLEHVTADEWKHKYSREKAAYPLPYIKARGKFWPTVGRINNLLGDRKLIVVGSDEYKHL